MKERYKTIRKYPLYRCGNHGTIQRWLISKTAWTDVNLLTVTGRYSFFNVTDHRGINVGMLNAAVEVARLYLPPPPDHTDPRSKFRIVFRDGNRRNVRVANLMWEEYIPVADQLLAERPNKIHNPFCRKTGEAIIKLYATGEWTQEELTKKYKAQCGQVYKLLNGHMTNKWKRGGI